MFRTEKIIKAIEEKDFQAFADITIRDSNQFHAICQDTFPPCVYMNQTSHSVSSLIHQLNEYFGEMVACYTFDAGPNACIFLLEKVCLPFPSNITLTSLFSVCRLGGFASATFLQ